MNNNIFKILKEKDYVVHSYVLENYRSLNIGLDSFVLLIYLINQEEPVMCDFNFISRKLNVTKKDVMIAFEELKQKQIISVKVAENKDKKLEETVVLDLLYNKLFMSAIEEEDEQPVSDDIYSKFEEEFGRTLSPIEYELINGWKETGYDSSIIIEALKESVLNGVKNLKYVDRILFEWNKRGIKTTNQIKRDRESFTKKKEKEVEIPDFDWVNDEEDI